MIFNVITGLPRSGSTLLCNILNQNPRFHASSTSPLITTLNAISKSCAASPEFKNHLEKQADRTQDRLKAAMEGYLTGWYKGHEIVFDKCRAWANDALMLKHLWPPAKIIVTVRDLRNIFASIEKEHRKFPLLDVAKDCVHKTQSIKHQDMFTGGLVGTCINGVKDLVRRDIDDVIVIKYEDLTSTPKDIMEQLYFQLGEDYYEHDYNNIENTAIDCDGFYLGKYPHKGCGAIQPRDPNEWQNYVSVDVANHIIKQHVDYNKLFGYK